MRKKRCTAKKLIKSQVEFRQWGDLPHDLLLNIFNRIDPKDVFWMISLVCYSWQLACWDVLFWKVDLLDLGCLVSLCKTDVMDKKMEVALERVLRSVFDSVRVDDRRNSYGLALPRIAISDEQLVSVAERTPELQEILLIMANITGKGFSRAIRKWRKLNVISLDSVSYPHYTHIIQEIGINCVQLIVLSISSIRVDNDNWFHLDEYNAQVIANNLHGLRGFCLADCYVYELGLRTIMSKCRRVVRIELLNCIRALEVGRRRRCRRELDAEPFSLIEEPLNAKLTHEYFDEWSTDTLAGIHSITTVVNHLWK